MTEAVRTQLDNLPSHGVAEKAGFVREGVLRRRIQFPDTEAGPDLRDAVVWSLFAADWPDSPGAAVPVTRYDAAGRVLAKG